MTYNLMAYFASNKHVLVFNQMNGSHIKIEDNLVRKEQLSPHRMFRFIEFQEFCSRQNLFSSSGMIILIILVTLKVHLYLAFNLHEEIIFVICTYVKV